MVLHLETGFFHFRRPERFDVVGKSRDGPRLLEKGVAVQDCYPDGTIKPVLRAQASPSAQAMSEQWDL